MQLLNFSFDLDCRVAIYVPSTTEAVNSTDNTVMVKRVLTELSELFGGATATDAVGGWVSPTHGLITEKVTIVYSFCDKKDLMNRFASVMGLCEMVKKEMSQEAITLEINGQAKFV